jgi:hypothetical protein
LRVSVSLPSHLKLTIEVVIVLYLLPECWKLMVVECKKRNITKTVQMEGYRNRTIVANDENRLITCER